ncbi:hypothetical protein FRZ06_17765 [Anoxybacterium hadale]|uniref:Uncharacterized protein n=1 Tax=Anoxybacterium hadale TaxID=3408580 RepID=A0ACD1AFB1_9FIRM|nr:hypothetical protein FRZ06_17765 [Clostridiales bacterium]
MHKFFNRGIAMLMIIAMTSFFFPVTAFAASDEAARITYSIDADEELNFGDKDVDEDLNDACDDLNDEELNYIKFTSLPKSSAGTLFYKYDRSGEKEIAKSDKYYYDKSPYLKDITFVPEEDYSGTVTIGYTGYDEEGASYTGEIRITVEGVDDEEVITYKTDADEEVDFEEDDFNDLCEDINDEELDYIKFTSLPKSSVGTLYYKYDKKGQETVSKSDMYYYDSSPSISDITFVPEEDYTGTVSIGFKGYDIDRGSFTAEVKIVIGKGSKETMKYTISSSEVVRFDAEDFNDLCEELNDETLDYVIFSDPASSRGTLYYDYSSGSESKTVVSSSKKYYYDGTPSLNKITFVPTQGVTGTTTLSYKGYDEDKDTFTGTITITVTANTSSTGSAKIISYSTVQNAKVQLTVADFNNVCQNLNGYQLNYVQFSLPSSSSGTLYNGYISDTSYTSLVKSSEKYYYSSSPYIQNVSFVPAKYVSGTVVIDYTAYDVRGISYTGKVQVTITSGTAGAGTDYSNLPVSKYFKDVDQAYSWAVTYVDSLYEAGIISGTSTTNSLKYYGPSQNTTRGDFVLILYRALKMQKSTTGGSFKDVPSGSYYYDAIATAKSLGIATGTDNYFYPDKPITREDAMVLTLRAVNILGKTIASGDTNSLSKFTDGNKISDYAKTAVAALTKAGIITGSDDNHIYPQGYLTRVQVAAIVSRIK